MLENHSICQDCLEARWVEQDGPPPQIHLGDAGACCWCGAIGPVADYTSYLSPAACTGHQDDDTWQLADYARGVVAAYRTERRWLAEAIEALEEELWRQPDPKL